MSRCLLLLDVCMYVSLHYVYPPSSSHKLLNKEYLKLNLKRGQLGTVEEKAHQLFLKRCERTHWHRLVNTEVQMYTFFFYF